MSGRRVLSVASEVFPLVKTGGLADVVGALPPALAREGIEVRTLVPGYPAVMAAIADAETVHVFPDLHGGPARLVAGRAADLDLFAVDAPHLYARPGNPYSGRMARSGPTTRGASRHSRNARRRWLVAPSRPSCRRSRTRTTGRPDSYRRICVSVRAARAAP